MTKLFVHPSILNIFIHFLEYIAHMMPGFFFIGDQNLFDIKCLPVYND